MSEINNEQLQVSEPPPASPLNEEHTAEDVEKRIFHELSEPIDHQKSHKLKVEALGPPPDGGFKAWSYTVGGLLLLFNSWGIVVAFGTFQTYYKQHMLSTCSDSTISWIGSIQGFLINSPSIFTGRAFDASYEREMMLIGTLLVTFGLMMTSISTEFYQVFLAQGVCVGIGANLLFQSAVGIVSQYFSTKRALAIGITTSGSSLGGVIYPIVFRQLTPKIGFPWTVRVMGFIVFSTTIGPALLMKNRLPPRRSGPLIEMASFNDTPFLLYCGALFFGFFAIYIPIFYMQSYSLVVGISSDFAPYMVSIMNAASLVGRTLPNFAADKLGAFNMMIPSVFICMIMAFAWIKVTTPGMMIAFAIFYGYFSGGFVSMPPACIASMTYDHSILGTRIGMGLFVSSFGILIGTPIAGALLKRDNGGYLYAQICAGVAIGISATCMLLARICLTGPRLMKKA